MRIFIRIINISRRVLNFLERKISKPTVPALREKQIAINVYEVFFQENNCSYNRLDIIVRYLAIENYYNKNIIGFNLYDKMQAARMGQGWAQSSSSIFKELIRSYEESGYNEDSKLLLDKNLKIIDGSHRMALALYHGIETYKAIVQDISTDTYYGNEWFIENGFSSHEIKCITDKYRELHDRALKPFLCTLWPPVQEFFDEITSLIGINYKIRSYQDYDFDEITFNAIVKGVYAVDDIQAWKIQKKIQSMEFVLEKKVRVLEIDFEQPMFRLKDLNQQTLSVQGEKLKKIIRNAYKEKIDNYFHDIIIHVGDNYWQNKHISLLFNIYKNFSLDRWFADISNLQYFFVKTETPYYNKFPEKIPLSKDIDIICSESDYRQLVANTMKFCMRLKDQFQFSIVEDIIDYRTKIRLELNSFLILQFDISRDIDDISYSFIKEALMNRLLVNGYYILPPSFESVIRLDEYNKNPEKKHHLEYIQDNKKNLDYELLNKYCKFDYTIHVKDIE